jgi:DNA sulfur modification protein DndB
MAPSNNAAGRILQTLDPTALIERSRRPPMNTNVTIPTDKVKFINVAENVKPSELANEEAANTGGLALPGILFRQGSRHCISTAIHMRRIRTRLLEVNSAKSKGTVADVQSATNRPMMADHVATIANYMKENVGGRYILPPMTLNVQHPISVYRPQYVNDFGQVYLVIPETARLSVTDGGHRTTAIIEAYERMDGEQRADFDRDAVSVMITLESALEQVHQDFADCSKTKALPKSQLAAYDRRNPANGLVLDLIRSCPLFNDKIDSTSKTLSAQSPHLFLTNQVRQLVKELLVGDYALADDQFETKALALLGSSGTETYAAELEKFSSYTNLITETIPVLREIAALPTGTPRNIIKERRNEGWICLTATGMVIIGRIGHELFKGQVSDWQVVVRRLGDVDWSRSGPLWQGNIVRAGKMTTQRAPVRVAVEKLRREIGLAPNTRLDEELAA